LEGDKTMTDIREQYTVEEILIKTEEVKKELEKYSYDRQHGRSGKSCDDPYEEYIRLLNNLRSRQARARKKERIQHEEKTYKEMLNINTEEDEFGIRPVDERRYKACFKSYYIGAPIERSYIKRMTGLNLKQMYILQERTGFVPTPPIKKAEADADWKQRYETGDIY
jgi:hypothetical protein